MSSEQANTVGPRRDSPADATRVRRIHIIGGSGSGKTTLARVLARRLSVPAYDLDEVAYEGGAGAKRTLGARLADVHRITAEPGWVTEGIYLWWTEAFLQAADVIVWLDLPWRIAAWRIVARHARASLAGNNRHPGLRKLCRFLRVARSYYVPGARHAPSAPDDDGATSRMATAQCLEALSARVVRCRHAADVARFLRSTFSP
jgi:shikimate kinase